jgi:hypothetical protein
MLPEQRIEDEPCPVTDQILGELYCAGARGRRTTRPLASSHRIP